MGRPLKMQPQLQEEGILTDNNNIEYARLTLNNLLVINELELYFSIVRLANLSGNNKAPVTKLNQKFSLTGGWGYDPAVDTALRHLKDLKVVDVEIILDKVYYVTPLVTPAQALKKIPKYTTRAEIHASLEEIDE